MGLREVRIQVENLPQFTNCLVVLARAIEDPTHCGANDQREWFHLLRPFGFWDCIVLPTNGVQVACIARDGSSMVWVKLDSPP